MGHSVAVWDCREAVKISKDSHGIHQILLRNPQGASARVSLHGGQVTSWKNELGEELLFTSSKVTGKSPKAMRGGIPICFPQFGNCGSPELHGFARNKMWKFDDNPPPLPTNGSNGISFVDLLLKSSEEDMKYWPHGYDPGCLKLKDYDIMNPAAQNQISSISELTKCIILSVLSFVFGWLFC